MHLSEPTNATARALLVTIEALREELAELEASYGRNNGNGTQARTGTAQSHGNLTSAQRRSEGQKRRQTAARTSSTVAPAVAQKRTLSAAGKRAIAKAQRARWAKMKAAKHAAAPVVTTAPAAKRKPKTMTAGA